MALGRLSTPRLSTPRPPRALLLDGLGTLLELLAPERALAAGLAREHGIELTLAQARWAFGEEMRYYRAHHLEGRDRAGLEALRGRCAEVLGAALPAHAARALTRAQLKACMLGALRLRAYPEVPAALGVLRARGLKLVVASNWDVSLGVALRGLGLAGELDGVVTSAAVGAAKPSPRVFAAALALAGVAPEEAVHVGDDPRLDVAGARAAGITPVLLVRDRRAADTATTDTAPTATVTDVAPAPADDAAAEMPGVATISSLAQLPAML